MLCQLSPSVHIKLHCWWVCIVHCTGDHLWQGEFTGIWTKAHTDKSPYDISPRGQNPTGVGQKPTLSYGLLSVWALVLHSSLLMYMWVCWFTCECADAHVSVLIYLFSNVVSAVSLWKNNLIYSFYPLDAMLERVLATATCPSVRLSQPVLYQNGNS